MTSDGTTSLSKSTVSFRKRRRQTDVRTALIILSLAMLCYTAWTPYAIVSLIGQFGPVDENGQPKKLSPMATAIPAFLAKTAIVFDPLVYGFSSPQFRNSFRQIQRQQSVSSSGYGGNRAGPNNMMMTRTAIQNSRSPRPSSHGTCSSFSRNAKMIAKDQLSKKMSNDPYVTTSTAVHHQQLRLSTDLDDQRCRRGNKWIHSIDPIISLAAVFFRWKFEKILHETEKQFENTDEKCSTQKWRSVSVGGRVHSFAGTWADDPEKRRRIQFVSSTTTIDGF